MNESAARHQQDIARLIGRTVSAILLAMAATAAVAGDPKYVGDVVGRSLSATNLEGHVGLWTGGRILEMYGGGMREVKLEAFKTAGKDNVYYGAKGKGSANRTAVTSAAFAQRKFNPDYGALAEYWIGGVAKGKKFDVSKRKWLDVKREYRGKFRCDTLVNYAYRHGGAGDIRAMTEQDNKEVVSPLEYYTRTRGYTKVGQAITPRLLYSALPNAR